MDSRSHESPSQGHGDTDPEIALRFSVGPLNPRVPPNLVTMNDLETPPSPTTSQSAVSAGSSDPPVASNPSSTDPISGSGELAPLQSTAIAADLQSLPRARSPLLAAAVEPSDGLAAQISPVDSDRLYHLSQQQPVESSRSFYAPQLQPKRYIGCQEWESTKSGENGDLESQGHMSHKQPKRYNGVRQSGISDTGNAEVTGMSHRSPAISRPRSPALSLVDQVGQWPFSHPQARIAVGTIQVSPPVSRPVSPTKEHPDRTLPVPPPRTDTHGDNPQGPVAQKSQQPLAEVALSRDGPGENHSQDRTPIDPQDQDMTGPPQEPYQLSRVRRGDVPGYSTDRQGFTALLRVGDRAQGQGRPIAAASRYREEDQPARKKLDFVPGSNEPPGKLATEREADALRQGMLEILLAQREASARHESQMREFTARMQEFVAHQAGTMRDLVTDCQGQIEHLENQSFQREEQLRQEVSDTLARGVEAMQDGLARLTQALPDMVREIVPVQERQTAETAGASTPKNASSGVPGKLSSTQEWSHCATLGSIEETPSWMPERQPDSADCSPDPRDIGPQAPSVSVLEGRERQAPEHQNRSFLSPTGQVHLTKVNRNQVKLPEFAG